MNITIQYNEFWRITKHGPHNFTAHRPKDGVWREETRFYFSLDTLEQDFPNVKFPSK
jgi:hypothetical protein